MASNGIVKGLNVFKDKFVSMAEIRYLKAVEPFPFYQGVKRLDASILPRTSLPRIARFNIAQGFKIVLGYVLRAPIRMYKQGLRRGTVLFCFFNTFNNPSRF